MRASAVARAATHCHFARVQHTDDSLSGGSAEEFTEVSMPVQLVSAVAERPVSPVTPLHTDTPERAAVTGEAAGPTVASVPATPASYATTVAAGPSLAVPAPPAAPAGAPALVAPAAQAAGRPAELHISDMVHVQSPSLKEAVAAGSQSSIAGATSVAPTVARMPSAASSTPPPVLRMQSGGSVGLPPRGASASAPRMEYSGPRLDISVPASSVVRSDATLDESDSPLRVS